VTGQELYEHVRELARSLDVQVWICATCDHLEGGPAGAAEHTRHVITLSHSPDEPLAYLVALHELGHHADPRPFGKGGILSREEFAWRWALERALVPPSPEVWGRIAYHLRSYGELRKRWPRTFRSLLEQAERSAQ
jgi:hypothetical protein